MSVSRYSIAAILALALALTACGGDAHRDGRIELVLWKHQAGDVEEAAGQEAIARFNASQTTWHITAQSLPQGGYTQSIVAASLSGQLPCIMTVDQPKVASFVWAGHLRPLDNLIPPAVVAQITPAATGRYQGHLYSVGQFDAALAIFTRRSVLERLGARIPTLDHPWSLAEFDDILKKLKAAKPDGYPLDLATRDVKADWWTYAFSPMLQSFGGDLIDRRTMQRADGVLDGPDAQRFGNWFRSLFARGLVNRREPDDQAFIAGRAPMVYTGNWWAPQYRAAAGDDLLILPPPDFGHGPVIGGGSWQWAISSTCKHPDGAAAFINFLLQPREMAAMADAAGMIPVSKAGAALSRDFRPGGQSRIFFDLMQRFARQRPATPAFSVVSNSFFVAMQNIADGRDPHDALDDATDAIDQTIADNRGYRASAVQEARR